MDRLVGGVPLELPGRNVRLVVSRSIAEGLSADLANEGEVFLPAGIVTALLHFIDTSPVGKYRVTVFDSSGKQKRAVHGQIGIRVRETGSTRVDFQDCGRT